MTQHGKKHYSQSALDQFAELSKDADLVLFSFLSDNFLRASNMTRYLRDKISAPMIWGGVHATIEPEASMKHVDILCRGDGDEALPELVDRMAKGNPIEDVRNFWFRKDGKIISNEMRPLFLDIDSNPWPDYSNDDHFIRDDDDRLKPVTDDLLFKYHNIAPLGFPHYPVTSARGCAYHCSYCYNAAFNEMFKGQRRLRFRSLPDVVDEIAAFLERFSYFKSFSFSDDDFFLRPMSQLTELADLISQKLTKLITPEYWGCCVTPQSLDRKKLSLLSSVGLRALVMGVQTGSERLNREVYTRPFKNSLLYEKSAWLDEEFHREVIMMLDILVCGPYETEADTAKTVEMILKLPQWFNYSIYKYTFYPGSPLYNKALEDKLIPPGPEAYDDKQFMAAYNKGYNYTTHLVILLTCAKNLIPRWFLRMLSCSLFRSIGKLAPTRCLDLIPWRKHYFSLWSKNQKRIYKDIMKRNIENQK